MFLHNINPVLWNIGPFSIRYYSLVYIFGFLLAYFLLVQLAKKKSIKNLNRQNIDTYLIYLIVGVILGARIFEIIFWEPSYYFAHPEEMIMIWHGGLSFHGGLAGAIFATFMFCRKFKLKFYDLADLLVIPAAIALAFGRIANFINGELWGKVTSSNFCIDYSHSQYIANPPQGCRYPSQIYESLKNFFIFAVLMIIRNKKWPKGFLFWLFITLYGFLRFIVNFFRDDPAIVLGISIGQILSLIMGIVGTIMLFKVFHERSSRKASAINK
jgi:phosphatidylglycerol---prolipoprotein diacylglyceryl transferase